MAVSNNFSASTLDLNGEVSLSQPTALVWGPDGRLYVTEVDGDVKVLTVEFGDKPGDGVSTAKFYVTESVVLSQIKGAIQNHNDNGTTNSTTNRQVTGIDATPQYDANGNPMVLPDGTPMVTVYVTSSDSRIGAGNNGSDSGLDTNSGVITKMTQTGANTWTAVDIVRGLPRSEENHATNGLEIIQTLNSSGKLVSERLIVASGGNANNGAPSNNFAGQQETALSAAILEIDLDAINDLPVLTAANGRKYVYNVPTLNDPTRPGTVDNNDPFGGNDGFNGNKLLSSGPVSIYSPGYRNAYDVLVTEDGRVWTYDNGANNSWGGRPIGEAGDNGNLNDFALANGYIATNLNNGEGNTNDPINLVNWNPSNKDQFHEITRSDDLEGRTLSAGQGGAQTFTHDGLTYVYGGHPNPTRAEGSRAGLLFTPGAGAEDAYLLVSNQDSFGNGGGSDYAEVIAWLQQVESANPKNGIYGVNSGDLTEKVLSVTPGVLYDIYKFSNGSGAAVVAGGSAPAGGTFIGKSGLPSDIAQIVAYKNSIEGNYKEAGKTDGALDTALGSINGIAEYTSTVLDQGSVKMSGAIIATQLNGATLIVMGRNANGSMSTTTSAGFSVAADRTVINAGGGPLGIDILGDDYLERGLTQPFRGSIWTATFNQNGPLIEIFQPANGAVPLAGSDVTNMSDRDLDGVENVEDPFEFDVANGYELNAGQSIVIDFSPLNSNFPTSISGTGLVGAALDGETPNRDAQTAAENFPVNQQFDGLFDIGGNILPGGNAPILQIKKVVAGTVVGSANTARDALHTGIRPGDDVGEIIATVSVKNWIPEAGGVKAGQLTGMMFGDGTQENFLRVVFGSVNGQPGLEVGYEINDANYTSLAKIALPALNNASITRLDLRLSIDIENGFAVKVFYRFEGQSNFTEVNLNGFVLPVGVLRDVLTGDHEIGAGATAVESGAAIGFLAQTSSGNPLEALDFYGLTIDAEPKAQTGAETILYRVNAGGSGGISSGAGTIAALDGGPNWVSDATFFNSSGPISITGTAGSVYGQSLSDQQSEIEEGNVDLDVVPWQLFVNERADNVNDATKLTYNFDVDAGKTYKITLYYTENWNGIFNYAATNGGATRQFDVTVEGQLFSGFTNLNPIAEAADLLNQPVPTASQTSLHGAFLGRAFERTVTYTAGDDTLSLQFQNDIQNPKINGIQISEISAGDAVKPVVQSITVSNPQNVQDGPRTVTVVVTDETGFSASDFSGLTGAALSFSGIVPDSVSNPSVNLSNLNKTATLTYTLSAPDGAWPIGQGQVTVAAGAFEDAAGNTSAVKSATFILQPNLSTLVRGEVGLAINVGSNTSASPVLGGAIAADTVIRDAFGQPVSLQADSESYYSPGTKTVNNYDGGSGQSANNPAFNGSAYHTYRDASVSDWTATYPVPNGVYVVELHFAELFHQTGGQRQGDYTINGQVLANNFDAFTAAGGGDKAVILTKTITVTDGKIVIGVSADTGQPGFNAIVVYDAVNAAGPGDPDLDPLSFGIVQLKSGQNPSNVDNELTTADLGNTTFVANRAFVAISGDGDKTLETGENAYVTAGRVAGNQKLSGLPALNTSADPVTISAHGRTGSNSVGAIGREITSTTSIQYNNTWGFGLQRSGESSGQGLTQGDSLTWTLNPLSGDAQRLTGFSFTVNIASSATSAEISIDFDGNVVNTGSYSSGSTNANADAALRLNAAKGALVEVDFDALTVSVNGATVTGASIQAFFNAYDASAKNVLTIGGIGNVNFTVANLVIDRASGSGPIGGGFGPTQDLDGDGIANNADANIDGDGAPNATDVFYYDAQNGRPLASGQTIRLDFNTAGTPFQNGFTGVLQGTTGAAGYQKETGAGIVTGGQLVVATTNGDTGAANNPQNAYHLGVKTGGGFTVETVIENPFGSEAKSSFKQLGLVVSLDSTDFLKFVAGNVSGNFEFSYNNNDIETKVTGNLPAGYKLFGSDSGTLVAKLKLFIDINVSANGSATAVATATVLNSAGVPVAGISPITLATLNLTGDLEAALANPSQAVGVGVTHTHGAGASFDATYDYLEIKADGASGGPSAAADIILAEGGVTTTDSYGSGVVGSAVLKVTAGVNNVQRSNFGAGSFDLENTGGKKIAAVFFDANGALYPDMVFDEDGSGGDDVFKDFSFNAGSDPSALAPSGYDHFFLPARSGVNPLFANDKQNSGLGADGGWRGLLLKFGNSGNGFANGESVFFAGDMDPNSLAGLEKTTVDANSQPAWDLGGVSGAELIGSSVTVMFSDGSFATGQLFGDGSQAGAQAIISQAINPGANAASLTVNGVAEGGVGSYGGSVPTVVVSGQAGSTVRVVMTKGFDPMGNTVAISNTTADQLVADRLEAYDFEANNAAEFQTLDVVIPSSGSVNVGGFFAYNNSPNGNSSVPNFNKLQLGFAAATIDPTTKLAIGAVSDPIYLTNSGPAVSGGAATPPSGTVTPGGGTVLSQTRGIAISSDDFEVNGGPNSNDLELGVKAGASNPVGLRFTGFDIDEGAEIESAYFLFEAEATSSGNANLTIQIHNTVSPVTFSGASNLNGRTYRPETVSWNVGAWQKDQTFQSADVSGLIEALIGDNGLDPTNALAFRLTGAGLREAYSFNSTSGDEPRLVINYVDDFGI